MSERKPFGFWNLVASGYAGFLLGIVLTHSFGLRLQFPFSSELISHCCFERRASLPASGHEGPPRLDSDERLEGADVPGSRVKEIEDNSVISDLRKRKLLFPLKGFSLQGVRDTFDEPRGNHIHEAIDILAPRNTPVVAVEDGTVARLWYSRYGGITVYHYDPTQTFAYYYAHLERYAENLQEGDKLTRGQVIGYVGTSGNAPPETPHLHFTIFYLTKEKHWWVGIAINPYLVYQNSVDHQSLP